MKKSIILLIGLQIVVPVVAQNQETPVVLEAIAGQDDPEILAAAVQKKTLRESFVQKIRKFHKVADFLNTSRDCLSGIGCTKKQSYWANYALGTAIGFGTGLLSLGYREVMQKLSFLTLLTQELGYRYLVKKKVYLFRCLTFRGCDDQTKRYAFYELGLVSGGIGVAFAYVLTHQEEIKKQAAEQAEAGFSWEKFFEDMVENIIQTSIKITNVNVKKELGLLSDRNDFAWYQVLGFKEEPSSKEAKTAYHKLSVKYHPDRFSDKELGGEIMKVLNAAKEKIPAESRKAEPQETPAEFSGVD